MNEEIARKTELSFIKLIRKPQLTYKLLSRPPFRFIHDIVTAVSESVSIMKGLFSTIESNPDNLKDKESRIKYLSKFIEFVSLASNSRIDVKPGKIVAGLEADKTNHLFQKLAEVAKKKMYKDQDIVNKVLISFNEKPLEPEKTEVTKKTTSPVERPKHRTPTEPEPEMKIADVKDEEIPIKKLKRPLSAKADKQRTPNEHVIIDNGKEIDIKEHPISKPPLPAQEYKTQAPKRPTTSRRGPPQIPTQSTPEKTIQPLISTTASAEAALEEQSSDEDFLVQEKKVILENSEGENDLIEEGGLVKKLLKSKEEFSGGENLQKKLYASNEKDVLEIKNLRDSVQKMTTEVNEMAKLFDFSHQHEDLALIIRELEKWREENEQLSLAVSAEEELRKESEDLIHVQDQIKYLNEEIREIELEIERTKAHTIQNNEKIDFTLGSLANSTSQ